MQSSGKKEVARLQNWLVTSILWIACESWTFTAELQWRIQAMEMRCYHKVLLISYKDHVTNEEVRARIQQAIGLHEDLLTIVKRCKLQWYGHVSCCEVHKHTGRWMWQSYLGTELVNSPLKAHAHRSNTQATPQASWCQCCHGLPQHFAHIICSARATIGKLYTSQTGLAWDLKRTLQRFFFLFLLLWL